MYIIQDSLHTSSLVTSMTAGLETVLANSIEIRGKSLELAP